LAAAPGTSNHERGLALDLSPGVRSITSARNIYYDLGIAFPVKPEDWHAEMYPNRPPLPEQPAPIPQKVTPTMHTISNLDGRLEEFDLYLTQPVHRWQDAAFQNWSPFVPMRGLPDGQQAEDLSVGRTHDGRLEVTVRCPGGIRYRAWQKAPSQEFDVWVPA
jgi:LAS superfamily LD-carboxypeptidase LdcB